MSWQASSFVFLCEELIISLPFSFVELLAAIRYTRHDVSVTRSGFVSFSLFTGTRTHIWTPGIEIFRVGW